MSAEQLGVETTESRRGFIRGLGLFPAVAVNMSQMVGIGPFITVPLIVTALGGPQVMVVWVAGAVLAICDGLVWAELGAAMPAAGGSYVYLREAYQYWLGRFMPFLFVWTTLLATPLIMSTGMIGMAQYVGYFWKDMTHWQASFGPITLGAQQAIAVGFTVVTVALLYRRIESVAAITKVLWGGMILTVGIVIVASYTHFNPSVAFSFPKNAFALNAVTLGGVGAALAYAIYDYLGYYTVAYCGDEVRNPGRVIPWSIILSILGVMVIDLAMNIGMLGVIPWQKVEKSTSIGSDVLQAAWGNAGAVIITLLIIWTAFASVYTGLLGASRLPFNAARDRLFFKWFAELHPTMRFPHVSLLVIGLVTAVASFFTLTDIIAALTALIILSQFIAQIVGLFLLRYKQPSLLRPYRQWLYPLPSIVALIGWLYVFGSTPVLSGWKPVILAGVWTAAGVVGFLVYAYVEKTWPFGPKDLREEFVEEQREFETGEQAIDQARPAPPRPEPA